MMEKLFPTVLMTLDVLAGLFHCLQSVCRMQESQYLQALQRGLGPAAGRAVGRGGESSEFSTS